MIIDKTEYNVKAVKAMTKTEFLKAFKHLENAEAVYYKLTGKKAKGDK